MKFKFVFLLPLLISCNSFSEAGKALRNEKTRTTDEFLIEKRGPLSLPPKMGELPKPNILEKQPKWSWFMVWSNWLQTANSPERVKEIYNFSNTLTKDEIKN